MPPLMFVFFAAILALAVYHLNAYYLTALFMAHRGGRRLARHVPAPAPAEAVATDWPRVTVQLPVYNEAAVVARLIDAVARLDYPTDRLEIHVLDDSTDETTALARERVDHYRRQGRDIALIRRPDRAGYKAGNLRHALTRATGEHVALFDADFLPDPPFLTQTVPHLTADPGLGFVQVPWGHLNRGDAALTAAQAVLLDGQFVVEHVARNRRGFFIPFNGTAGVWRRACIEDAGGWQDDTLCEDCDLGYRAQLAGWRAAYLSDVVADAELPPALDAFKAQQARWATGHMQCLRKLVPRVLAADLPHAVKLQALLHLSKHLSYALTLLAAALMPLLLATGGLVREGDLLALLPAVTLGLPTLHLVAQLALAEHKHGAGVRAWLLFLIVDSGLAWNNTVAIVRGLSGARVAFVRTPKVNTTDADARKEQGRARRAPGARRRRSSAASARTRRSAWPWPCRRGNIWPSPRCSSTRSAAATWAPTVSRMPCAPSGRRADGPGPRCRRQRAGGRLRPPSSYTGAVRWVRESMRRMRPQYEGGGWSRRVPPARGADPTDARASRPGACRDGAHLFYWYAIPRALGLFAHTPLPDTLRLAVAALSLVWRHRAWRCEGAYRRTRPAAARATVRRDCHRTVVSGSPCCGGHQAGEDAVQPAGQPPTSNARVMACSSESAAPAAHAAANASSPRILRAAMTARS